ncbi:hypothetical protein Tdes44962_MAKER08905 [Teratosphaeria destructans]|uniref:Uncharacterized protein n=1 Tax=Teratosphaeria destructans TaxID=418781 RepID=A0A9W7SUX1_9PEZI|nr:hypothetical protein Tdes44962_MAKER08905 [Teratosphaeria destructans]
MNQLEEAGGDLDGKSRLMRTDPITPHKWLDIEDSPAPRVRTLQRARHRILSSTNTEHTRHAAPFDLSLGGAERLPKAGKRRRNCYLLLQPCATLEPWNRGDDL